MSVKVLYAAHAVLLMAVASVAVAAESTVSPGGDPRVESALKEAGLSYTLDEGDYRLDYDVNEQRSQRVWVASKTARMILGAWQVNQSDDEYLVVYLAQVDAAADAATLQEVIEVVMYSADRIEKQLGEKDAF